MAEAGAYAEGDGRALAFVKARHCAHEVEPFASLASGAGLIIVSRLKGLAFPGGEEFAVSDGADPAAKRSAAPGGTATPCGEKGGLRDIIAVGGRAGQPARERAYRCLMTGDQLAKGLPVARHRGMRQVLIVREGTGHLYQRRFDSLAKKWRPRKARPMNSGNVATP